MSSLTPSNASRMMSPAAWGLKLTPSNSPYTKNTAMRSPVKSKAPELSLSLRQVIGTTTNSANGFDSLPSGRSFAFTAGAAAVIATVADDHHVSQRFYRARPTTNPLNPSSSVYGGPATPTNNEGRSRTAASLRDAGIGASPLASPAGDWADSPANKTWTARERIKAATCVSFSPDGKYLAVGETGYKPRVLIFSTSTDAPSDTPLTCLSDHTFGVRSISFSPDSQYLASLGSANDGFLYIWSINSRTGSATLLASNKCTSNINKITWLGSSLVTVGTRHVKVWRTEEPVLPSTPSRSRQSDANFMITSAPHKTLPGRNCLLGSLLETTFTSVVAVSPSKAIVCSDKGDICLIDDTEGTQRFSKIADAGFGVTAMAMDSNGRLHLAGSQGGLRTLHINDLLVTQTPPPSPPPRVQSPIIALTSDSAQVEAVTPILDYLVTVDSRHSIRLSRLTNPDDESVLGDVVQKLPAHGEPVLGVRALPLPNLFGSSFFTWSAGGSILFWSREGVCKEDLQVSLEQVDNGDEDLNELRTVSASYGAKYIVSGDKYGVLRVTDCSTRSSVFDFKAHAGEITDIAIYEDKTPTYVACAGRDRTVQVFTKTGDSWDLLQTLDEHVGAVTGILFSRNGSRLVSCSSDRTVVVRNLVSREEDGETLFAFVILRTITLKASPVSIVLDVDQDDVLLVSTIDRQIQKYDLRNGHSLSSFRASDSEGGDAVVMCSLAHIPTPRGSPLIAGVSSTDKSIRLYEESGTLVGRDWGHTEGVTDIALVNSKNFEEDDVEQRSLVTVAVDGTIFIWNLDLKPPQRQDISRSMDLAGASTPTNRDLIVNKPPLRRVFSQNELARFQRSPDEESTTPTGGRSPRLRKRLSKFSLAQAPKLDPSPMPSIPKEYQTTGPSFAQPISRKYRNRSPSPPSPRNNNQHSKSRRPSLDARLRTKASNAPVNEFGSLGASTEQVCRTLRAYRKRLANSSDSLSSESVRELERELAITARAVGERAVKAKTVDETVMVKLLDQYSERLVQMLDEKIAISVKQQVRQNSVDGAASPSPTPDKAVLREESGMVAEPQELSAESGA
ncbi:WD domain-containing protein, partial [Lophium mytilinum]